MAADKQRWTILHTEASNGWGGQEIRILSECKWMREQGHTVFLAASEESALRQRATEAGFEVFTLPFKQATQPLDAARLFALLTRLKPDVIGTHSSSDSWAGLGAAALRPSIARIRYRHISTPVKPGRVNQFQYRNLSDHIITTGECIRQPLVNQLGVDPDRVTVVATGISPPAFATDRESARLELAAALTLPQASRFIGCVAVLRSWKGHGVLMRAFDQLAAEFPHHHLILAGDGPCKELLLEAAAKLPCRARIHLVGHRTDPWPLFRAFDVAVLASVKNEGIPQSLLQAMFAETPVVGTEVGGIPEIVRDGETGLLAPPNDPSALALALRSVLSNSGAAADRAARARALAAAEHTWQRMGEKVTAIYQRVLQGKTRRK